MCSVENNKTTISSMNNFNNMTRLGSQMSKFNRVNINDIKTEWWYLSFLNIPHWQSDNN